MTKEELERRIQSGLEQYFLSSLRKSDDEDRHIHLSLSKIGACPRQIIFSHLSEREKDVTEVDDDVGIELSRNWGLMLAGLWWEEFLSRQVIPEFKRQCITNLLGIVGHCDFLYHDETGKVIIIECKTRSEIPTTPLPSHEYQLGAYLLGVKENGYMTVEGEKFPPESVRDVKGFLVYICRDNPALFKVFEVKPSERIREKLSELISQIREFEETGTVPPIPREFHPFNFPCFVETRYEVISCPFHRLCWGTKLFMGGEGISDFDSLPSSLLEEGFRRWLNWKESERSYRHFVDEVIKPTISRIFPSLEKSVTLRVRHVDRDGFLRIFRRNPPRRLNLELLRRMIERVTSYSFSDDMWETLLDEAKEREGEPSLVVEFTLVK